MLTKSPLVSPLLQYITYLCLLCHISVVFVSSFCVLVLTYCIYFALSVFFLVGVSSYFLRSTCFSTRFMSFLLQFISVSEFWGYGERNKHFICLTWLYLFFELTFIFARFVAH